jgi:hypothetical protein
MARAPRLERRDAFGLQLADLRLDLGLVDAHDLVVLVCLDSEGRAEGPQKLGLVHLGVALHRLVIELCRDRPQVGHLHLRELFKGVRHVSPPPPSCGVSCEVSCEARRRRASADAPCVRPS